MPVRETGDQRGARFCTAFYAQGTLSTDLSQHETDLTVGTNVVYESATVRLAGVGRRSLRFRILATADGDVGTLWRHGTGAASESLSIDSGELTVVLNNVVTATWREVDIMAAETARVLWTTMPNPATTGASDAMLSVLSVENEDTGSVSSHWFTHAEKATTTATAYFGAIDSSGTSAYEGTILAMGYDRDVATLSTLEHDWGTVLAEPAPAADGMTVRQLPPMPFASGMGAAGEFFGLAAQWSGTSHLRHRRRSLSPLVNERFPDPARWQHNSFDSGDAAALVPDGSGFGIDWSTLRHRPLSEDAAVAWVRAHLNVYTSGPDEVEVAIRCYSFDTHPLSVWLNDIRFIEARRTTSDPAGHVFGGEVLQLARGYDNHELARGFGGTWLALAILFNPEEDAFIDVESASAEISDWHVAQRHVAADDGALGFGGG
ncbi:MAG: hypothetical protein ACRBN8_22400 [Nannocystales bacterium]